MSAWDPLGATALLNRRCSKNFFVMTYLKGFANLVLVLISPVKKKYKILILPDKSTFEFNPLLRRDRPQAQHAHVVVAYLGICGCSDKAVALRKISLLSYFLNSSEEI